MNRRRYGLLLIPLAVAACSGGIIFNAPYTPDTQPPTAPANLTATALGPTTVYLQWDAASDNVGVERYSISRQNMAAATWSYFVSSGTTYTDGTVAGAVQYCYFVTAVDYQHNTSAPSNTACVTPP